MITTVIVALWLVDSYSKSCIIMAESGEPKVFEKWWVLCKKTDGRFVLSIPDRMETNMQCSTG